MSDSLERCMERAEPLLRDMHDGWHAAIEKYRTRYPADVVADHDDTTTANCIRSHMWTEVQRRFYNRPDCVIRSVRRLKLLLYRDLFVFRFKKVDADGAHQNYPTAQQDDFDNDQPLPGIPPAAVRLTSGYQPDASSTAIERVIIAKRFGKSAHWTAQVNVVDGNIKWLDITPARFDETRRFQRREGSGASE